jgi:hypothetical protein
MKWTGVLAHRIKLSSTLGKTAEMEPGREQTPLLNAGLRVLFFILWVTGSFEQGRTVMESAFF